MEATRDQVRRMGDSLVKDTPYEELWKDAKLVIWEKDHWEWWYTNRGMDTLYFAFFRYKKDVFYHFEQWQWGTRISFQHGAILNKLPLL